MQVHFDQDDFIGAQAVTTAAVMRALAQAIDPQEMAGLTPVPYPLDISVAPSGPIDEITQKISEATGLSVARLTGTSEPVIAEWGGQAAPASGVDSEGYPWDERIHASSRSTVADGTWRRKRGVDDALVAQVRAEWDAKLRGASSTPAPEAPTEAERLQADHVSTMPVDPATVGFGVVPPPPVAPATGDAWPDDILGPRVDTMAPFPQFMAWAGKQIQAGTLDNARLLAVLQEHSVPILPALSAPEHVGKIPAIARQLAGA